jgi:hypothetical protein
VMYYGNKEYFRKQKGLFRLSKRFKMNTGDETENYYHINYINVLDIVLGGRTLPYANIYPRSIEEVQTIVNICRKYKLGITCKEFNGAFADTELSDTLFDRPCVNINFSKMKIMV